MNNKNSTVEFLAEVDFEGHWTLDNLISNCNIIYQIVLNKANLNRFEKIFFIPIISVLNQFHK